MCGSNLVLHSTTELLYHEIFTKLGSRTCALYLLCLQHVQYLMKANACAEQATYEEFHLFPL